VRVQVPPRPPSNSEKTRFITEAKSHLCCSEEEKA